MSNKKVIVFDLDDTLLCEFEFLKSAYLEIAHMILTDFDEADHLYQKMIELYDQKSNVFEFLVDNYDKYTMDELLLIYRNHKPKYTNLLKVQCLLNMLKNKYILGVITDGRSITQKNKIVCAGIHEFFSKIIISEEFGSEKPSIKNYEVFHQYNSDSYYYVGDNIIKDFIGANSLGWKTICLLNDGRNIHSQNFDVEFDYLPHYMISDLDEVADIIELK